MPSDVLITPASSKIDFTDGSNATKRLNISGTAFSFNSNLNVLSSTSLSSAFKAEGVNGTLFEVTDDLSNSLLSVNTIGGLPVFEVFANNSIIGGQYGANDFVISGNKIGLGLSNPVNKLSVSGAVSIGASYNVAAPANGLIVQGNVGIGTVSPTNGTLQVYNASGNTLSLQKSGGFAALAMGSETTVYALIESINTGGIRFYTGNGTQAERWKITSAGVLESTGAQTIRTSIDSLTLATNAGNGHVILSPHGTGNVGIGTATPSQKLEVQGNIKLGADNAGNYIYYIKDTEGTIISTARSDVTQAGLFRSDGWGNFTVDKSIGIGYSLGTGFASSTIGNGNLYVLNTIGINTTSPLTKLDVRGGSITSGTATSTAGSTIIAGYYGSGALTVLGTEQASGGPVLGYAVTPSTSATGAFLSSTTIAIPRSAYTQDGGTHRWYIGASQTVAIGSAVTTSEVMRINSSGNLGIATSTVSYKLHVQGGIYARSAVTNTTTDLNSLRGNVTTMGYNLTNSPSGAGWITVYTSQNFLASADILSQLAYDNYNQQKLFTRYSADYGATWSAWKTIINSDALSGTTNYIAKFTSANAVGNSLIFDNGTNVAIGSNATAYGRLQISATTTTPSLSTTNPTDVSLIISNSDIAYGTMFATYGDGKGALQQRRTNAATYYNFSLQPHGGDVGIGTLSPSAKLEISGSSGATIQAIFQSNDSNGSVAYLGGIQLGNAPSNQNSQIYHNSSGDNTLTFVSNYGSGTGNKFVFAPGGTERVRFQQNGNVGLGVQSTNATLHIKPTTLGANGLILERYASTAKLVYMYESAADGYIEVRSGADVIVSKISGYASTPTYFQSSVGIGTSLPGYLFSVNTATDVWHAQFGQVGGNQFRIGGNTTNGAVIGAYSDNTNNNPRQLLLNRDGGNVAVGASSANNKLHVNGSTSIGGGYNTAAPTNGLIVEGSVGIGVTSPSRKLIVNGDCGFAVNSGGLIVASYDADTGNIRPNVPNGSVLISDDSGSLGRGTEFLNGGGIIVQSLSGFTPLEVRSNSISLLYVASAGNVGIGTITPSARLHVNSTTSGATLLRADGTNGTLFSVVDDLSDSLMSVNNSAGLPVLEVFADDRVVAGQYGANDFVLVNNKLGLGTNNPQYELDIVGSGTNAAVNIITRISSTASSNTFDTASVIAFTNTTTNVNAYSYIGSRIDLGGAGDNAQSLIFATNATNTLPTEKMRIKSDGNVGIGTASPIAKLDIASTQSNGIIMRFDTTTNYQAWIRPYWNSSTDSRIDFAINRTSGATPDVIMSVGYGGNVGVGTISPAAKLHVNGSMTFGYGSNATFFTGTAFDASNYLILQNNTDSYGRVGLFINAKTFNGASTPSTNDGWALDPRSGIRFRGWLSGDTDYDTKFVIQHLLANATNAVGDLGIFAKGFSTTLPAFVLTGGGSIGIGTTTPAALLQIGTGTPTAATGGIQFGGDTGTRLYRSASGIVTCSGTIAATFSGNLTGNVTGNVTGSSGSCTGNAANVTGTVAIANGGSGQTSAQAAMNAFAGAVTAAQFLRGNGTNVVMSAIQAADVPTLNQNTTGSSGSCTGNAATASLATTSDRLTTRDNRTISPSSDDAYRLRYGFTSWANNNTSPYADYLHLRSYSDASGGNDNLVMFRKDAIGMRIYQAGFGTSVAYSSFKDIAFTDGSNLANNSIVTNNITNSNVTYAKIQNVSATSRILGRVTAGAGVIEELTAANVISILGGTTVGNNFLTLANPGAIAFPRINADNTVSALDAATFRTAIGAGTGNGSVTSVGGTGTVSGLTLTGTVTGSGNLTLGGTLSVTPSNFASQTANTFLAAPNGAAGAPTFRAIVAADVPTLNQNTTGSSGSCTGNAATATNASQLGGAVAAKYVRNDTDGTAGDIYSLVTITKSLTLTTSWIDTGISAGTDLISGAYILTLNADNYAVGGGHYNETYAGTMYWYAGATNSTNYDEIPLHKSGHAPNNAYINLRTLRGVSGVLKLQIISSVVTSGASNYIFKFRRII